MAQPILMPKMGQSTEDCTIVKWRKREGDAVAKGDILFEVETEKAVLEIESFYDGTLIKVTIPEGQPVPIGTTVAFVGKPGEPIPAVVAPVASAPSSVGAGVDRAVPFTRPSLRAQRARPQFVCQGRYPRRIATGYGVTQSGKTSEEKHGNIWSILYSIHP